MAIEPRTYIKNDKKIPAEMSGDAGKSLIVNPTEDGYVHEVIGATTNLTGQVIMWPTNVPPPGYLICNGTEHDTAQYPSLSAILGESSPGKFLVPNIVFPKNSFGTGTLTQQAESVGTHDHTLTPAGYHGHVITINSVGAHGHYYTKPTTAQGSTPDGTGYYQYVNAITDAVQEGGAHSHTAGAAVTGDHLHDVNDHVGTNQPACTLLTFCIKT